MKGRKYRNVDDLLAHAAERRKAPIVEWILRPDLFQNHRLEDLLAAGIDMNDVTGIPVRHDVEYRSTLALAISDGRAYEAVEMIQHGADPNGPVVTHTDMLHLAIDNCRNKAGHFLVHLLANACKSKAEAVGPTGIRIGWEYSASCLEIAARRQCAGCIVTLLCIESFVSLYAVNVAIDKVRKAVRRAEIENSFSATNCIRTLVARGARIHREKVSKVMFFSMIYTAAFNANEGCREAAVTVLCLQRAGGKIIGNGRDVMRLIAKEVWMSRMHDDWITGMTRTKRERERSAKKLKRV